MEAVLVKAAAESKRTDKVSTPPQNPSQNPGRSETLSGRQRR